MIIVPSSLVAIVVALLAASFTSESTRDSNLMVSGESNMRCVLPANHTEELVSESGYANTLIRVVLSHNAGSEVDIEPSYTATICGQGIMTFQDFRWKSDEYRNRITSLLISNYYYTDNMTDQYVSEIETIQAHAFSECIELSVVNLCSGKGFRFIDSHAFANCTGLNYLQFPDSLFGYGSFSFYRCNIRTWSNDPCESPASEIECFGESSFEDAFLNAGSVGAVGYSLGLGKNALRSAKTVQVSWSKNGCGSTAVADEWVHSIEKLIDDDNIASNTRDILIALAAEARSVIAVTGVVETGAFRESPITTIILSRMREIRANAFSWCPNLREIEINDGYFIHEDAFVASPSITKIVYCGEHLFTMNGGLVNLPASLASLIFGSDKVTVFGDGWQADDNACATQFSCTIFWPPTMAFISSLTPRSRGLRPFIVALAEFCDIY